MLLRIIAKFTGIEMYVTFSEAFFEAFFVPIFLNVPSSTCGQKWTKKTNKFYLPIYFLICFAFESTR